MADSTRITDVINPEVLSDTIINKVEDNLFLLPGVSAETRFPIPTKGTVWEIPYADKLGDLETFVAGTPLVIQAMTQDKFRSVVIRKAGLYGVDKIVKLAGYKDPMDYFSQQFSELLLATLMNTQINVLAGGVPTANINDQTTVAVTEALIQATKQKLGDRANVLKHIVMNSAIYATLEAAGKITWQPRSQIIPVLANATTQALMQGANLVPTIAGLIIYQTDKLPIGVKGVADYNTHILGDRAMGLYYQQQVQFGTDEDISLQEQYIAPNFDFVMPLYGVDYTSTDYADTDLATTGNYTLKWDHKLVEACTLIAKA